MTNKVEYLKTYEEIAEECFNKWGYYYPPRNWDEFNAWETKSYEKYLKDKPNDHKKTKSYVSLLTTLSEFGFYHVLHNLDFELLNNVLFQTSRHNLLSSGMTASGTDHCNVLMKTLTSFSCNDFEVIDYFFPKELGLSKGTYYTEVSVNLLMVEYYNQLNLIEEALNKAEKFIQKKITKWEKFVVLYFKALLLRDVEMASTCLQELSVAYQKMEHSVSKLHNKLAKYFAWEIHGLYRLARQVDQYFFNQISMPNHHSFFKEFELWQKENNYPIGQFFYEYPTELDYMNKILKADLPTVSLHNPYPNKKKLYKDVDKFTQDLTENAMRFVK